MNCLYKLVFLSVILISGCGYAPMFEENTLPANKKLLADGFDLYQEHCSSCHGVAADGEGILAPSLPIKPSDLTDLPLFPAGFIEFKIATGSNTQYMPAWDGTLTKEQIQKIGNYLRSIKQ